MSRTLTAEQLAELPILGDPQISPDGRFIAYVVQRLDPEKDEVRSNIWIVPVEGGEPYQLTQAQAQDRLPRWSPDGQLLAFVSDRSGQSQIYVIAPNGGEARRIPTPHAVASAPAWSPDGRYLAYVARVFSKNEGWLPYAGAPASDYERAERLARTVYEAKPNEGQKPKAEVKVVTRLKYRFDIGGEYGDLRSHVFVVPAEGGEARRVTSGDFDHEAPAWSPDGRYIAAVACRREDADWLHKHDIWLFDVQSGDARQIFEGTGSIYALSFSPDGTRIAFLGHDGRSGHTTSLGCWTFEVSGAGDPVVHHRQATNHAAPYDRPAINQHVGDLRAFAWSSPVWSADGRFVYFLLSDGGHSAIYRAPVDGGQGERVSGHGRGSIAAFSLSATGLIAYQYGDTKTPDEIFAVQLPPGEIQADTLPVRQLTRVYAAACQGLDFQDAEPFRYRAKDKLWLDGWVIKPAGYEPGKRYPTVLSIHGGPQGAYGDVFHYMFQFLASNGYAVVYANPRGSECYGQAFADACFGDWGGADFEDIMGALDHVIEMGIADPDRCVVTGWSYGGYMTCWTVTQTDRFKAAVAGACVSNRHSFYGTSDIGVPFGETEFPGNPWDNPERLLERSPISHVKNVKTPLLLLHGESDLRCPVTQSEEFFVALKRLGKNVAMVRYPGANHSLQRPSHKVDRLRRTLAFFDYWTRMA
ncbi:MAG: S9 family peptidase [Alicyclobacillaceae bacterium]|nr:S9 family peptidase [Alicyclobacillaceae bacterium]